ncbi:kinesin family member 1/13/14 [Mucor circinelloides 1006PhL]|uniref:Kinesin family member 1/13/14 n=1 Tax=Mucor circinelloides f. circinelloides (strain 1006PhL) TaxID=1220926 RepID=S2J5H0_MUCC1|nr:kinesin family member 1/13/14 [Mucor circinelloides 1006PhL]
MSGGGNIKVVVRCRPMNAREIARGAVGLIRMDGDQTIISRPPDQRTGKESEDVKAFTFDKSYWSADKNDPRYADQQTVYNDMGEELLDHAFDGYNCCIFAYGQTGSGKSYSMMGYGEDIGIIPRTCSELFNRITTNSQPNLTYRVEVSYIEIYNEKVRDLLNPKNKGNLKVREHPSLGPYVEDLSRLVVTSFADIEHLMDEGNKARTVAATNMNETSSRSHAVFTLFLTQKRLDDLTKLETEKVARISLVDLAGSERANSTGATGARLKEGANINRSLTTLGKVIAGLAEQSSQEGKRGKKKEVFIPYRDSVLTWLLKDSLGGNSKTAMIAAISQADYDETLSTLRYADQAKRIKNKAIVNEDPNAKLIRDLKDELDQLRDRLRTYAPEEVEQLTATSVYKTTNTSTSASRVPAAAAGMASGKKTLPEFEILDSTGKKKKMSKEEIIEQLQSSEKLLANLNESWEEKLKKTEEIHLEREKSLKELGITIEKNDMGVYTPKTIPFIVNLNEDPLMSECLMYQIKPGLTRLGRQESDVQADIRLSGSNIQDDHCTFENKNGTVTLHPGTDSLTMVNGMRITAPRQLKSGYRIILGYYHIFRFNNPEEVRKERDLQKVAIGNSMSGGSTPALMDDGSRPDSPSSDVSEVIDWNYARREAALNHYGTEEFEGFKDEELDSLYDNLSKVRNSRRTRSESRAENDDDNVSSTTRDSFRNSSTLLGAAGGADGAESICTDLSIAHSDFLEERLKQEKDRMQKELDNQKRLFEAKIHRMSRQYSQQQMESGPMYTQEQIAMIQRVLTKWRQLRTVDMAEVVLTNAVMLKEANIISRELNKQVLYQFAVIEDEPFSNPLSFWEPTSALHQFETDEDTMLMSTPKPCVGVRVIDKKNQVIYVWSLEKLKQRLHKMRNLYNFMDKPLYRKHFNWEDPFFENPCPKYTFIGAASLSLRNLISQQPYQSSVEIICHSTGQVRGKLTVLVSPIARSAAIVNDSMKLSLTSYHQPTFPENDPDDEDEDDEDDDKDDDKDDQNTLQCGQNLLFEIQLIEFSGIHESEFTDVHVQFKLSSFGGVVSHSPAEKIFATEPANYFESNPVQLDFKQTLSLTVTPHVLDILQNGFLPFEVFGQAQPRVLLQQERWDDQRERPRLVDLVAAQQQKSQTHINDHTSVKSSSGSSSGESTIASLERRSEEELLTAERHDIVAWVEVRELSPSGEYTPVQLLSKSPMDKGYFTLRQGLQRRICFTLSHTSGRQFEWTKIRKASIGHVRLLDSKGRILESPAQENIPIKLLNKQQVFYNSDGTSRIIAQGAWDSSQHECIFLNRLTDLNSRVILNLRWEVEAERCEKPVQFNMDIALQIQGRDRSTGGGKFSSFRKFLYPSGKQLSKYSGVFLVHLKPPMTRRLSQLWRLNTASKYVHGEEFLGSWRPRGVSLVNDFTHIQEFIKRKNQVAFTRQVLTLKASEQSAVLSPQSSLSSSSETAVADSQVNDQVKEALLKKVIDLWQLKLGTDKDIVISQDPPVVMEATAIPLVQEPLSISKLIAEVELITQSANISKKGYLLYQEDAAQDLWVKRWFVIRRPYIYIYTNDTESDEQGVINVASVRIDYNEALEQMIQRTNVFALYTNNNAYTLQSGTRQDMINWIQIIDQKYPMDSLLP